MTAVVLVLLNVGFVWPCWHGFAKLSKSTCRIKLFSIRFFTRIRIRRAMFLFTIHIHLVHFLTEFLFHAHTPQSQAAAVQENKMTVTLIAVVLLFLVCQTPTAIFLLYRSVVGETDVVRDNNVRLGE